MAAAKEDFLYGEDLNAILEAIDEDILLSNSDFDVELTTVVNDIPEEDTKVTFSCSLCPKVCVSKRGLTRHTNAKHGDHDKGDSAGSGDRDFKEAEKMLHPLYFKKYMEEAVSKLAGDECYPSEITNEFKMFKVGGLDNVLPSYALVKDLIKSFDGDAEKFYPLFYKNILDIEHPFGSSLSRNCSVLLGFELANLVLCHLSGSTYKDDLLQVSNKSSYTFSEKELSVISYLGGYVFSTMYRRIRFSSRKTSQHIYHQQYLAILLAGKSEDTQDIPQNKLVNVRDRGGLWKVKKEVVLIFTSAEELFRSYTSKSCSKIDSKEIVSCLMKNFDVKSNFNKILQLCTESLNKEVSLNLLEDLLLLFVRVRTFSYVKDKQQLHKIASDAKKSKSLRTELKKKTSSLDQGH